MANTNNVSTDINNEIEDTYQKPLTLGELADMFDVQLPSEIDPDSPCERVLTQSAYLNPGEVVISAGWYWHGKIIPEALEKGAALVFCSQKDKQHYADPRVIPVDDPMDCVIRFERWRAEECKAKRIAITGSVGKTTTIGLVNAVIANSFPTLTHNTMANSHGAVLRTVQRLEPTHEFWVQEVGGVQPGYIESSAKFLEPDAVVLTNIGLSHLDLYKTKENIIKDKCSLEKYAKPDGVVIINRDDSALRNMEYSHRVITCSFSDPQADYHAENLNVELDGIYFDVVCEEGRFPIHLNLFGNFNVYNALFAFAVGRWAGVPPEKIAPLLENYRPGGMRQNMIHIGGYNLFVDCFNAEPKTVLGAAEALAQIPADNNGRRIFVTGHINKIGEESPALHKELGRSLAKIDLDQILLFAGDSKYTYEGILEEGGTNAILMETRQELEDWLRTNVTRDDIVSFKSSPSYESLALTVDRVYGTSFENGRQFNEGTLVESDGFLIRLRGDNIAEIEGYEGPGGDVVIPGVYGEHTVRRISPRAFHSNEEITSVVIPDSVDNIGQEAFYSCTALSSLHLPASLKYVGKNAFNYCRSLKKLVIPDGTIHLERHAFYDCIGLTDVTVPASVGYMGPAVFGIMNPRSEKTVRFHCERGSYAEHKIMRQGMTHFGGYNLLVDSSDDGPERILCAAETLAEIPNEDGARRIFITDYMDENLGHSLAGLDLNTILLLDCDSKCIHEESNADIILLENAKQLEDWIRGNVVREDLVCIKSGRTESKLAGIVDRIFGTDFENKQDNEGTLVESDGFLFRLRKGNTAEIAGYNGPDGDVVIPGSYGEYSVRRIAPQAFQRRDITSVVIPDSVENIGYEAFYSCCAMKSIHLPASLKIIGKNAFNFCIGLKEVDIPEGTIHLDRHAFFDCNKLKDVTVPSSVGFMGEDVFGKVEPRINKRIRFHCDPGSYAERVILRQGTVFVNDYKLLVDPFNVKPETVLSAAEAMELIEVRNGGRKIFITGFMDAAEEEDVRAHEELGRALAGLDLDRIILFAGDGDAVFEGIQKEGGTNALLIESAEKLEEWLRRNVTHDDLVFFRCGQFQSNIAKTIDDVFGTKYKKEKKKGKDKGAKSVAKGIRRRLRKVAKQIIRE